MIGTNFPSLSHPSIAQDVGQFNVQTNFKSIQHPFVGSSKLHIDYTGINLIIYIISQFRLRDHNGLIRLNRAIRSIATYYNSHNIQHATSDTHLEAQRYMLAQRLRNTQHNPGSIISLELIHSVNADKSMTNDRI